MTNRLRTEDATKRSAARARCSLLRALARSARGWQWCATVTSLCALVVIALVGPLATGPARAGGEARTESDPLARAARGRTIALFDEIARARGGFALRAWVNDGSASVVPIGSDLAYHFVSDRAAHLIAIHLDSQGVATLLLPNGVDDDAGDRSRLTPEVPRSFPSPDDAFSLRAEPPLGQEHVVVVATARPIEPADLGVDVEPDAFVVREAADAPALASRLLELYLETPVEERAAVHLEQQVTARPGETEYSSVDIVDYFATRTRSIERPRLDLHIHFASNSDALDGAAQRSLDEVADALRDPRLHEMRFTVAGHTDDTGTAEYNALLSRQRAASVVRYLSQRQGIEAGRLEVDFYGESRPLESNATGDGRRMNRRVEFELLR